MWSKFGRFAVLLAAKTHFSISVESPLMTSILNWIFPIQKHSSSILAQCTPILLRTMEKKLKQSSLDTFNLTALTLFVVIFIIFNISLYFEICNWLQFDIVDQICINFKWTSIWIFSSFLQLLHLLLPPNQSFSQLWHWHSFHPRILHFSHP